MKKNNTIFIIIILLLLVLALIIFLRLKQSKKTQDPEIIKNALVEIPNADVPKVEKSKLHVYSTNNEVTNIDDYWDSLYNDDKEKTVKSDTLHITENINEEQKQVADLFKDDSIKREAIPAIFGTLRTSKQESKVNKNSNIINNSQNTKKKLIKSNTIEKKKRVFRKSEGIGSICGYDNNNEVGSIGSENYLIESNEKSIFKCMFVREMNVSSSARVPIRILEDIIIEDKFIPKNTHIMFNANLSDRLYLVCTNLEYQGHFFNLNYAAYDIDGAKGLYCPGLSENIKEKVGDVLENHTSTYMSSMIGRMAQDLVQTGLSLIKSKKGKVSVRVPSGYVFYIMTEKK